jgi:hypothetical protein
MAEYADQQQQLQASRALEIARDAVVSTNKELSDHRVVRRETPEVWVFTFLPLGRVRGGGVEVTVSKIDFTIKKIVYLQ